MDSQDHNILLMSLIEVQELILEQAHLGNLIYTEQLWQLQREKAERVRSGLYYSESNHRGTSIDTEGDGEG